MKRSAVTVFALMLILGMNPMAMALDDGTYDFYGTYSVDSHYADGSSQECALTSGGMACPSSADFCIKNLQVSSNSITNGEGEPYYGIAIGKIVGTLVTLDYDGSGPVNLTVDDTGDADVVTSLDVESIPGLCGIPTACVNSWAWGRQAPNGELGTVTGAIGITGFVNGEAQPETYPSCSGGTGSYAPTDNTTETATGVISNEQGDNQERSETGSKLVGSDPVYTFTLKHCAATLRTMIGGIPFGDDVFTSHTWDGTLCRRTDGSSCIPDTFPCPDEND